MYALPLGVDVRQLFFVFPIDLTLLRVEIHLHREALLINLMHVNLFKRVEQLLHEVSQVLVLFDAHLLLFGHARLHGEQASFVDGGGLDQDTLPVFVLFLQVDDPQLDLLKICLVLMEVVAADLLDLLRVLI